MNRLNISIFYVTLVKCAVQTLNGSSPYQNKFASIFAITTQIFLSYILMFNQFKCLFESWILAKVEL